MRQRRKRLAYSFLAFSMAASFLPRAEAKNIRHHTHYTRHSARSRHVIQCVAFVHQTTDFQIRGNARDWWGRAAGLYARGHAPETGSILSFRPARRMPLGHVALVSEVLDSRTILIDQSHWASNGISRNVRVVDVSPDNDWTSVRVALNGATERLGSIYQTNGFIYHRTPEGQGVAMVLASNTATGAMQDSVSQINGARETASAPDVSDFFDDAPNRSIR